MLNKIHILIAVIHIEEEEDKMSSCDSKIIAVDALEARNI